MNVKAGDHLVLGQVIPEAGNLITVSNRGLLNALSSMSLTLVHVHRLVLCSIKILNQNRIS